MNRTQRRALDALVRGASTRKFNQGRCLNCNAELSGLTGPEGEPDAGSIMVCAYCSHIMEWTGDGFAELSDQAIKDIAGDPAVLAVAEFTALYRKAYPEAACKCGALHEYGAIVCRKCGKTLVGKA